MTAVSLVSLEIFPGSSRSRGDLLHMLEPQGSTSLLLCVRKGLGKSQDVPNLTAVQWPFFDIFYPLYEIVPSCVVWTLESVNEDKPDLFVGVRSHLAEFDPNRDAGLKSHIYRLHPV